MEGAFHPISLLVALVEIVAEPGVPQRHVASHMLKAAEKPWGTSTSPVKMPVAPQKQRVMAGIVYNIKDEGSWRFYMGSAIPFSGLFHCYLKDLPKAGHLICAVIRLGKKWCCYMTNIERSLKLFLCQTEKKPKCFHKAEHSHSFHLHIILSPLCAWGAILLKILCKHYIHAKHCQHQASIWI